jgi:hypothetical protein
VASSPKNDGIFMISCYDHTDNLCMLNGSLVQNVTLAQALWNWQVVVGFSVVGFLFLLVVVCFHGL